MIKASILADSVSPDGARVTTFELEYPRYIHSELLTHRVFSRNSASSRAIPLKKMIEQVTTNMVIPKWTMNQKGMKGINLDDVDGGERMKMVASDIWTAAALGAIKAVEKLHVIGIHKQNANRLLEPFIHIKTVLTGSDFENFFSLRVHEDAQPEIRELAFEMQMLLRNSEPKKLKYNQWHLPYASDLKGEIAKKLSVSCCAQVSYRKLNKEVEKALEIYERLISGDKLHASPFEHVCRPLNPGEQQKGNLIGWHQYREDVEKSLRS